MQVTASCQRYQCARLHSRDIYLAENKTMLVYTPLWCSVFRVRGCRHCSQVVPGVPGSPSTCGETSHPSLTYRVYLCSPNPSSGDSRQSSAQLQWGSYHREHSARRGKECCCKESFRLLVGCGTGKRVTPHVRVVSIGPTPPPDDPATIFHACACVSFSGWPSTRTRFRVRMSSPGVEKDPRRAQRCSTAAAKSCPAWNVFEGRSEPTWLRGTGSNSRIQS